MPLRNYLVISLYSLALCLSALVSAQDKQLSDAKTAADISAYAQQEMSKYDAAGRDPQKRPLLVANLLVAGGEKWLEIAQDDAEKKKAYDAILNGLRLQVSLTAVEPSRTNSLQLASELKKWFTHSGISGTAVATLGREISRHHNVSSKHFVAEWTECLQSPECTLSAVEKAERVALLTEMLRSLDIGDDPKLYGKTLDDKDFDWTQLRGKYVLIKFTATWCGPCQMEIPGMLEAYEKYHDKGLEIISVYVRQPEADPVATVKNYVAEKKLPWIILSEALAQKAGHPEYRVFYFGENGTLSVPKMVLTNEEGTIIMTEARGVQLQAKLAEIFQ